MRRLLLAMAMTMPASAPRAQTPVPTQGSYGGSCLEHQHELPSVEGRSEGAARAIIGHMQGIRAVRVLTPSQPMTMDYRPDRATLVVRDGIVERADCG